MNRQTFKNRDLNVVVSLFIVMTLILRTLNITISETMSLNNISFLFIKILLAIILLLMVIVVSLFFDRKNKCILFGLEFLGILILLMTYFRYPSLGISVFISYSWLFLSFIPAVYFMFKLTDFSFLFKGLYYSSFPIMILCTIIYFFHTRPISTNMVFSYTLLMPVLIHIIYYFNNPKKFCLLMVLIFESYMMLTYASRGTLVCIFAFVIMYLLSTLNKKKIKYFFLFLIVVVIVLFLFDYFNVYNYLYDYYMQKGKYIRILDLLSSDAFFSNNGRFEIYSRYLGLILEKPFIGWGVGADLFVGIYPHNFIIEIVFNFGIIIGIFILSLILFLTIKAFAKLNVEMRQKLLCLLFSGIVPLLFSFSYLEFLNFWIYLGFIFAINRNYIKKYINKFISYLERR